MTVHEMHQSNRAAWNEAAHYAETQDERIEFLRAGGTHFCDAERPYLQDLGQWCQRVIHLQCAGGTDTLSLWNPEATELKLDPVFGDYFQTEAQMEQGWGPTYMGDLGKPKEQLAKKYETQKTFGQTISPLLKAGLRLEALEEHAETYWELFENLPKETVARLPNTFSLLMCKD